MYFNIENRDENYINQLKEFLQENYGFKVQSLKEYNRGWYGETWEARTDKCRYFIKINYFEKQAKKYQKSFQVLEFMNDNGIDFVSQVIKSKENLLYTVFNSGTVGVFEFVDWLWRTNFLNCLPPHRVPGLARLPLMNFSVWAGHSCGKYQAQAYSHRFAVHER